MQTAENVTYEALSYSWGYGQEETSDSVQPHRDAGISVKVCTPHYARSSASRSIIASSGLTLLCINQSDLTRERDSRSNACFRVYFKAERVIGLARVRCRHGLEGSGYQRGSNRLPSRKIRHRPAVRTMGSHRFERDIERTLCNHPWWRRVWIRQEAYSPHPTLLHPRRRCKHSLRVSSQTKYLASVQVRPQ